LSPSLGATSGDSCPACAITPLLLPRRLTPFGLHRHFRLADPDHALCCIASVKK
jgi:hypothetical protein